MSPVDWAVLSLPIPPLLPAASIVTTIAASVTNPDVLQACPPGVQVVLRGWGICFFFLSPFPEGISSAAAIASTLCWALGLGRQNPQALFLRALISWQ